MVKYTQTSARWGYCTVGKQDIGMTPNIARNKEARISCIMGYLAKKNDDIGRYEARRLANNLPNRPFNAGYRNCAENKNEERYSDSRSYTTSGADIEDSFTHLTSGMGKRLSGWRFRQGEISDQVEVCPMEEIEGVTWW